MNTYETYKGSQYEFFQWEHNDIFNIIRLSIDERIIDGRRDTVTKISSRV